MSNGNSSNIEYTRRLYQNVLDWYQNADAKAQVVLAIDGGLVAFISSTVFTKPEDIKAVIFALTGGTWALLICMVISLAVSMGASIYCLWARIYPEQKLKEFIDRAVEKAKVSGADDRYYPPTMSCFFQFIERLEKEKFRETLRSADAEFEIKALASQIHILSGNVRKKHFAVNIGFMFAAAALAFFFISAASYALKFT